MMYHSDTSPSLTGISIDFDLATWASFRGVDFRGYLQDIMSDLREPLPVVARTANAYDLPLRVFQLLTSADYCYLSGARVEPYKQEILDGIARAVAEHTPVRFYLDIGGGYHSALEPGRREPSFEVGLAELLLLRQIRTFVASVHRLYGPGAKFTLIVDNLRAAHMDGVALEGTTSYCASLRELIAQVEMGGVVELLVESERFTAEHFTRESASKPASAGAETASGRAQTDRARLYSDATSTSERLLSALIAGVRLTLRATATTLCFRPFPGGDSRIHSGEVALLAEMQGRVRPVLLTSRNVREYARMSDTPHAFLPRAIPRLIYAKPLLA